MPDASSLRSTRRNHRNWAAGGRKQRAGRNPESLENAREWQAARNPLSLSLHLRIFAWHDRYVMNEGQSHEVMRKEERERCARLATASELALHPTEIIMSGGVRAGGRERFTKAFSEGLLVCSKAFSEGLLVCSKEASDRPCRSHWARLVPLATFLTRTSSRSRRLSSTAFASRPPFLRSVLLITLRSPGRWGPGRAGKSNFAHCAPLQIEKGICEREFQQLKGCWRTALRAALAKTKAR